MAAELIRDPRRQIPQDLILHRQQAITTLNKGLTDLRLVYPDITTIGLLRGQTSGNFLMVLSWVLINAIWGLYPKAPPRLQGNQHLMKTQEGECCDCDTSAIVKGFLKPVFPSQLLEDTLALHDLIPVNDGKGEGEGRLVRCSEELQAAGQDLVEAVLIHDSFFSLTTMMGEEAYHGVYDRLKDVCSKSEVTHREVLDATRGLESILRKILKIDINLVRSGFRYLIDLRNGALSPLDRRHLLIWRYHCCLLSWHQNEKYTTRARNNMTIMSATATAMFQTTWKPKQR